MKKQDQFRGILGGVLEMGKVFIPHKKEEEILPQQNDSFSCLLIK